MPYAGIARRGLRASAAERRALASGFAWEWTPSTEGGGAPRKGERAHLLVVTFRRPAARSLFVRVIANLNRHFFSLPSAGAAGPFAAVNANRQKVIRIRHILAEVVERKIAATTITATVIPSHMPSSTPPFSRNSCFFFLITVWGVDALARSPEVVGS
eukprot:1598785-Rhodomonas_salina.1